MRGTILRIGLALTALISAPAAASWTPTPDDALLFDVRLNQYRLGDGVRGYATPTGVCVDFADTIIALDLPIRLDKQSRHATGWAFDERHTVTIDRVSDEEHIMNSANKVAPDDIRDTPEGWCVATKTLSRWLGVTVDADTANALLFVRSDHKLPPQLAAERRARVAGAAPTFDLASLPHSSAPWRGIKAPSVDVVASFGGLSDRRAGRRVDAQYELYASGEAGPVAYDARLSSDRHGLPSSLRVRAYRTDPEGHLPLSATQIAAGDVTGISTPLVAQSSVGRGVMISNRPVDLPDSFDKTDFRGELPRGWDAELYRNGQLLAFANDREDGRYEFLDVPLLYGNNRFEIVLYGPQGQIRREVKSVPVGLDSIPPKKTWYWAGIDEDGRDLINFNRMPAFGREGWRGSLGIERGLDMRTSVAALVHSLVLEDSGRMNYLEAALRRAIGPTLSEVSASFEARGGHAVRAQTIGEIGSTHFGIETIWAGGGYQSDRVLKDVTGLHTATIDTAFGNGRAAIPVHFDARYTTRSTGNDTLEFGSRASVNLGRIALTGDVEWRDERSKYGPDPPGVMEAGILANARIGRIRLRGEAHWRLSPDSYFDSATLVGEWSSGRDDQRPNDWRAEVGYDRALHRGRAGLGYIRRFDRVAVTATAEAATDGSVAAGLNLAFSVGPDPRSGGGFRVTSDKLATRGTTLVRVYRDTNANGRHDAGEPYEKDVQIAAGRVPVEHLTDTSGEVVVDGLEPFQPVLIGVDASSLPDPFVQPSTPGIVLTPRPGVAQVIELPLVSAGDVDGTLVREGGGNLEGVDLELLDAEARVVARTRSDFDGFFLFERVPYGRYSLRIAALSAQAARLLPGLGGIANVSAAAPSAHLGVTKAMAAARIAAK